MRISHLLLVRVRCAEGHGERHVLEGCDHVRDVSLAAEDMSGPDWVRAIRRRRLNSRICFCIERAEEWSRAAALVVRFRVLGWREATMVVRR